MNIAELLTIPGGICPDQEILVWEDQRFTYQMLQGRVAGVAAALVERGVGAGDIVGIMDVTTPATLQVLYACAAIGAVFLPLNFRARVHELAHMLGSTSPRLVLVGQPFSVLVTEALAAGSAKSSVVDLASVFETQSTDAWLEPVDVEDDVLAVLLFTSGTTAAAKAVMLAHTDLVNYVLTVAELANGEAQGCMLIAAPLHHIAGVAAALTATWAGRRIVLMSQFEPEAWLRLVAAEQVTHAFLVPTMLKRIVDHPRFADTDLTSLQVLSYGAAPTPLNVIRRAIEAFPAAVQFVNAFGQTETASTVTMLGPEDHRFTGDAQEDEKRLRRLSSIGRPLPDVSINIVDEDGVPLARGQTGEIVIATNRLMRGYFGQAEATRATLQDGWLRTRDLGWMDEDGYVFLAGRKSDMIIRGGENVAPEEVEAALQSHPRVEEAGVIGQPDEEWGEIVVAAVVAPEASERLEQELIEFCRQRLGRYKAPQRIIFLEALPRNDLGKLLRKDLRVAFADPAV